MNYSKMTKAQLIEIISNLQDELVHISQHKAVVADDSALPWEEQPAAIAQVQDIKAKTTTHAEIMRERMAAAKAQAMSTGVAVKA